MKRSSVALIPTPAPDALTRSADWRAVAAAYVDAALDSPHTRRAYARAIDEAMRALGIGQLDELTAAHLAAWRARLIERDTLAPSTVSLKLAAVRSFLGWARSMGACSIPADAVRVALKTPRADVRRPYQVLSEPEIGRMLAAADTARDRALLAVLFGAGLRVSEAVALDVADVLEDGRGETALHVLQGKGNKSRTVPVQSDVGGAIRAYLAATGRRLGQDGPLFRGHDRGAAKRRRERLTVRAVSYLVSKASRAAGIDAKRVSPHSLRHSYALRTLRYSGNVVAVSKLLGHSNLATTQRYVDHLAIDELRQAVPALPISA